MIYANGQPLRAPVAPVADEVDPRVAEAYRRHPSAGRILLGEGVTSWTALRELTTVSLLGSNLRGAVVDALIETCQLRKRPADPHRPEPQWARDLAPAPKCAPACRRCAGKGTLPVEARYPAPRAPKAARVLCSCADPAALDRWLNDEAWGKGATRAYVNDECLRPPAPVAVAA